MKDLFIKKAFVKKANTVKVSPECSNWGKEALNRFYSDFPELLNVTVRVTFKEKDEARGYAVGAINIGEYSLPIIIREFQLYPFDVALTKDNVVPFTTETMQMMLSSRAPFSVLTKDQEPETFMRFFDSLAGGSGYAVEKSAELLASVCDDVILEKLAELVPNHSEASTIVQSLKSAMNKTANYTLPVSYMYKEADGTYTRYEGEAYNTEYKVTTDIEPYNVGEDAIVAVETVKTASFSPRYTQTEGYVYRLAEDEDLLISKEGNYRVLVGKDTSVIKRAGYAAGTVNDLVKHASIPHSGDLGVLFDPESAHIKTSIVEMHKVAFHDDGLNRLTGNMFVNNHLVKFATLRGIKSAEYSKEKETLFVPESWMFAKLGEELPISKLEPIMNEKLASVEAIKCIGTDHFTFSGPVLRTWANARDLFEADIHKVAFAALQCGASLEDITEITKLQPGETHIVKQALVLPSDKSMDKTASTETPLYDTEEIAKLAVEMGSATGVDTVLGTAFLKKDNINLFVRYIPQMEDAASMLAKLLLYVRMGADGVNEISIRNAMIHLSKVIYQLYGVKNADKVR